MLDLKEIRKDPQAFESKLKSKDPSVSLHSVLSLDEQLRLLIANAETLKSKRNQASKEIGILKREGKDTSKIMEEVSGLHEEIAALDRQAKEVQQQLDTQCSFFPNLPMEDIPISPDPKDNVCIKSVGEKPSFSFPSRNHLELNEGLDILDFKRGAKVTGSGWPVYKNVGARLEWALLNYMLDIHRKNGFMQWIPPLLVQSDILYASGQLPKFKDQVFQLTDDDYDLYLVPTAEVALNGLHYDEILSEEELPFKYVAYTPCFRREAGAAGASERGLIRVHQFNKVELFCFTRPEDSAQMFETMLASAEEVLEGLELHYRNMLLVTGDMSFGAARTVDIEVWLPGQDRYYEVSSVSNCTDFQARRSRTRFKRTDAKKTEFVHTLNGSGLATARLLVALLENNQQADGSVTLPKALHPYLGGLTTLQPHAGS